MLRRLLGVSFEAILTHVYSSSVVINLGRPDHNAGLPAREKLPSCERYSCELEVVDHGVLLIVSDSPGGFSEIILRNGF